MTRIVQVHWMNRRGAGCMRTFGNDAALESFLSTLRREATVSCNGEIIGAVEPNDGRADDRRLKWLWWFEKSLISTEPLLGAHRAFWMGTRQAGA